jgi:hypothetical protein
VSQTETHPEHSNALPAEEQIRKIYAKDLKIGEAVHTVFKATRKERLASRAGKPYLVIGLADRTGEVDARVFDNVDAADNAFAVGDYLLLAGKVGHFHGHPQIIIERLERLDPDPIDPAEFAWTAPPPSEKGAKDERPDQADRAETKGERGEVQPSSHKAARQRLLRLFDNPQIAQALDLLLTHIERYIDDRVAQKLGPPRSERKPRGPRVEIKPEGKPVPKPDAPKRDALPEGLAFKPFSQLVGAGSSTEGPNEG